MMTLRRKRFEPTSMPSVKIDLGRYVTLRPRADGTSRVFFQVPARLRPSAWPSLIPLPIEGVRRGNLTDPVEVAQIRKDADALYRRLQAGRLGRADPPTRTVHVLIREWQSTSAYKGLKPRSVKHYGSYLNHIARWSRVAAIPADPDPSRFTQKTIEDMLAIWDGQPTTKRHVRKTFRLVMDQAIALGWRVDNPCDRIRIKAAKSKLGIWEQDDVDAYVAAAKAQGQHSIALIIHLEWEIGQRLTDVRQFRPGVEYDAVDGVFRFLQEKTGAYLSIPISAGLRDLLAEVSQDGQMFLFRNERTSKAYTEERLSKTFAWVRHAALKAGARRLQLRWLRHSCVVQLARAACTVPEIASITGHSITSVERILAVYLPRDNQVAWAAQTKRGIVKAAGKPG